MDETRAFIRKYQEEQLNKETLPQKLDGRFELLACIHVTETHASFLLQRKETGEKYLLKRGQAGNMSSLSVERKQQTRIGQAVEQSETDVRYWTEGDKEYLLRRYIEGQNLEEYYERNPNLDKCKVLDIAIQICDILMKLHHLKPPMIHRDIKPQNLILDRYGRIHLIDFETSRNFDRNKRKDTKFYGTELTAAPEQYGYAQTDVRTDIYAFGKVLCYLLTGDYQVEGCELLEGRFGAIVGKCCAFDPEKRYQSMEEVRWLLVAEQKRNMPERKKKFLRISGGVASLIVIFFAGMFLGNYRTERTLDSVVREEVQRQMMQQGMQQDGEREIQTDKELEEQQGVQTDRRTDTKQEEHTDSQPDTTQQEQPDTTQDVLKGDDLLYQAAAASLNKETVTEEDLQKVVRIAVVGTTVYDMSQSFELEDMFHRDEEYMNNWDCGTISDLSLLGKMTNLSEVYLYNQQITDIRVLEGLPIRKLYLSNNKIEDLRTLEKLPLLSELFISKNPIQYLPDFSKCTKLTVLSMNENTFADLSCLADSTVEQMGIRKLHVVNGDYSFLRKMPGLRNLLVWNPNVDLVEEMMHLTELREFGLYDYHRDNLDFLASMKKVGTLNIQSMYELDLSPLRGMDNLSVLSVSCQPLEDISVVGDLKNLNFLEVKQTNAMDLSVLQECRRLSNVLVNAQQAAYIEEHDPEHSYQVVVQ